MVCQKFLDVIRSKEGIEKLKSHEWLTTNPCFFHGGHSMKVNVYEDNKVILECLGSDSYIEMDGEEVSGVISENTSFLKYSSVFKEAERYIEKLKVINLKHFAKFVERCYNSAVSAMDISPFKFQLKDITVPHYGVKIRTELSGKGVSKDVVLEYQFVWGSRGMYIRVPRYYGNKYAVPYRQIYVTSKHLTERFTRLIRSDLLWMFDRFTCEIDYLMKKDIVKNYVKELEERLGIKAEYCKYGTAYRVDISDRVYVELEFDVRNLEPFINRIFICDDSDKRVLSEELVSKIIQTLTSK